MELFLSQTGEVLPKSKMDYVLAEVTNYAGKAQTLQIASEIQDLSQVQKTLEILKKPRLGERMDNLLTELRTKNSNSRLTLINTSKLLSAIDQKADSLL